jgi:leucyl aminopeptidase (aminopeptidase T)
VTFRPQNTKFAFPVCSLSIENMPDEEIFTFPVVRSFPHVNTEVSLNSAVPGGGGVAEGCGTHHISATGRP